jgi:hypothetical protein
LKTNSFGEYFDPRERKQDGIMNIKGITVRVLTVNISM